MQHTGLHMAIHWFGNPTVEISKGNALRAKQEKPALYVFFLTFSVTQTFASREEQWQLMGCLI